MAGASPATGAASDLSSDLLEVLRRLQSVGFCLDLAAPGGRKDQLRPLFDRVLSLFLKEILHREIRPFPAMLGGGREVDLFKVYRTVRYRGGYGAVTAARCWDKVTAAVGFEVSAASSVKLLYTKYLAPLDRWLAMVLEEKGSEVPEAPAAAASPKEVSDQEKKVECELTTPRGSKLGRLWTPSKGKQQRPQVESGRDTGKQEEDDDDLVVLDPDEVVMSDPNGVVILDNSDEVVLLDPASAEVGAFSSAKRKRNSMVGILNWVKTIAKNPGHSSLVVDPCGAPERKVEAMEEFRLVLLARKAMLVQRPVRTNPDSTLPQEKQRMHPTMYEDYASSNSRTDEKLRCSRRVLNRKSGDDLENGMAAFKHLRSCSSKGSFEVSSRESSPEDPCPRRRAKVPLWSGPVAPSDSDDSKWLGKRIWPPETEDNSILIEENPIGIGRQEACGCKARGSVECVRFHVAEKRLQLKRELHSAFYHWKFDQMGEEVSLAWTAEEEKRFKSVVCLNSSSPGKILWDQIFNNFPSKSRRSLTSYYFNVFLLRRRSYQNRVTPKNIDSDDEEPEFGFLSNHLGHDAVQVLDSKPIICTQNSQVIDLEEFIDMDY